MAQAQPTTCAHNAPGQVVLPNVATTCRQCGAVIKATPRTVDAVSGNVKPGGQQTNAAYPEDGNTNDQNWAFSQ